jgi:hypothetical protein
MLILDRARALDLILARAERIQVPEPYAAGIAPALEVPEQPEVLAPTHEWSDEWASHIAETREREPLVQSHGSF